MVGFWTPDIGATELRYPATYPHCFKNKEGFPIMKTLNLADGPQLETSGGWSAASERWYVTFWDPPIRIIVLSKENYNFHCHNGSQESKKTLSPGHSHAAA